MTAVAINFLLEQEKIADADRKQRTTRTNTKPISLFLQRDEEFIIAYKRLFFLLQKSNHPQQDQGTDERAYEWTDEAVRVYPQFAKQKTPDKCADAPDDKITEQSEAFEFHNLSGKPPCHKTDKQEIDYVH